MRTITKSLLIVVVTIIIAIVTGCSSPNGVSELNRQEEFNEDYGLDAERFLMQECEVGGSFTYHGVEFQYDTENQIKVSGNGENITTFSYNVPLNAKLAIAVTPMTRQNRYEGWDKECRLVLMFLNPANNWCYYAEAYKLIMDGELQVEDSNGNLTTGNKVYKFFNFLTWSHIPFKGECRPFTAEYVINGEIKEMENICLYPNKIVNGEGIQMPSELMDSYE